MKMRCYITVVLGAVFCVTGCDSSSSDETSASVLSAFNLSDISASDADVKTMTLTWDSASNHSGVTYSICEKVDDRCNKLTSVTDTLTATVTVDSLVDALSTDYYIVASYDNETKLSNEETLTTDTAKQMIGYFKASNAFISNRFGFSVALSDDGSTMAVGATGDKSHDGVNNAGAVYLFSNSSGVWTQSGYVSALNAGNGDKFGYSVALSSDGRTLAVGAPYFSRPLTKMGAAYLFTSESGSWVQSQFITASNSGGEDYFGKKVALSGDGTTLAVNAPYEDSDAIGVHTSKDEVNTNDNTNAINSGALYLFTYNSGTWSQSAYIKASDPGEYGIFGISLALSRDGNTLAVGARGEDSSGISDKSGEVYLFSYDGTWSQSANIKASNSQADDRFGDSVALSSEGTTLAVGAILEDGTQGFSGISSDTSDLDSGDSDEQENSGAVYLFSYRASRWAQSAYIKASNSEEMINFGTNVALSNDGTKLAVSANSETHKVSGVFTNTEMIVSSVAASYFGAAYLFTYSSDVWVQSAYVKASNTGKYDQFGGSVALSGDGKTLAVGANGEDNSALGIITDGSEIDGDLADVTIESSGAIYMY